MAQEQEYSKRARHPYQMSRENRQHRPSALPTLGASSSIVWTKDEQNQVAAEAYAIFAADPDQGRMAAIREAVKTLPTDRQLHVEKWFHVRRWIVTSWEFLDKQTGNNYAQPNAEYVASPTAPRPTPVVPEEPVVNAEPAVILEPEAPQLQLDVEPAPQAPKTEPQEAPTSKAGRKMIHWKPDEKEAIALAAAALMLNDGSLKGLEAVRQAQVTAAEPDRQRTLRTTGDCQEVIDRAINLMPVVARNQERKSEEARIEQANRERAETEERERSEREARENEARVQAETTAEAARLLAQQQEERDKVMGEAFKAAVSQEVGKRLDQSSYAQILGALAKKVLGDFMGEMATQIKADVSAQVAEAVRGALGELSKVRVHTEAVAVPSGVSELKTAPKDHLPRVVVVGLVNQQFDDLKKTFFGMAELTLVKSQAGGAGGSNTGAMVMKEAERADVVVALVEHCGIDVKTAGIKLNQNGKCPFIGITGSTSGAKRWIRQWLNGEVALAA